MSIASLKFRRDLTNTEIRRILGAVSGEYDAHLVERKESPEKLREVYYKLFRNPLNFGPLTLYCPRRIDGIVLESKIRILYKELGYTLSEYDIIYFVLNGSRAQKVKLTVECSDMMHFPSPEDCYRCEPEQITEIDLVELFNTYGGFFIEEMAVKLGWENILRQIP